MKEHDCTCDYCKNHECYVVRDDSGVHCGDPLCENNQGRPYTVKTQRKIIYDPETLKKSILGELNHMRIMKKYGDDVTKEVSLCVRICITLQLYSVEEMINVLKRLELE